MPVLKASRLKAVLEKARNAGQVEESVTIAGIELVMSSLPAEGVTRILEQLKDVPEVSYAIEYQLEHVCHSIVQVEGQSFRDVSFIEVDADESGAPPIKVERQQWLRDNVVSTWSSDMVQVAFRKVLDVMAIATQLANAGVQFKVEAETDEEKFRRILGELSEAGAELPSDMRESILKEDGLLVATSKTELADLGERAKTWAKPPTSQEDVKAIQEEPAEESPAAPPPRAPQQLVQAVAQGAVAPGATSQQAASEAADSPDSTEAPVRRVPLNQTPIRDPVPVNLPDQNVATANRRSGAPPADQVYDMTTKAARFAATEAMDDSDVVVLQSEPKVDPIGAQSIVDKPPVAGINSKYVNPLSRGGLNPRAAAKR
jgi:hypothetical protein